ncbi:response regulator receiver protein [Oscillatoriales cyanobacterium USR001]|nr:response regulator receiver protein [Oscillatoriales cyanobacterium USR001]
MPYGLSKNLSRINQLEEQLNWYKLLSENTHDIILFLQPNGKITKANNAALKAYGYAGEELLALNIQHLQVPEMADFNQPINEAEREEIVFETLHLRKDGSSFPVEITTKIIEIGEEKIILNIIRDITEQKQIEQLLAQQCAKERLIGSIQERIRQSLSLPEILHSTVAELRDFMQADRVIVHRFLAEGKGFPVVEAVAPGLPSMLKFIIHYPYILEKKYLCQYQEGKILAIPDIHHAGLDVRLIQLLTFFNIKARLVIPILQKTTESEIAVSNQLWGLLILHQCSTSRQWQKSEIDLIKVIITQIAIAIQQSELNQQLQKVQEKLQQLALLDPLTLIANRSRFDEYLLSEWQRNLHKKTPISVIIWQIDFFKQYNDTYGYSAGDRCLKQIATTIRSTVNLSGALIARYNGGEFAAILPNTETESALLIVEEIRFRIKALEIPHTNSKISKFVTISYGIASTIPDRNSSPAQMISDAENALCKTKKARLSNHPKVSSHPLNLPNHFASNQPQNSKKNHHNINQKSTNIELLMGYVAYYLSRGKSVLSSLSGPLYFRGLVYEYCGYHQDFQNFWTELQQRRDFRELYVEGDIDCFGNFLDGSCTVGSCARCNLPIPISEGSVYNVPNCTLCNHQFASEKIAALPAKKEFDRQSAKTSVVTIGTPPSDTRKLKKLFAINGFEVTFLSKIEAVDDQFLPNVVDLVLIYAEISELQGKAWAEKLRCYQQLKEVPIVGLTSQAKFSLPWINKTLGIEDYILDPLGGERLANHLRQICELQSQISAPALYWFPC